MKTPRSRTLVVVLGLLLLLSFPCYLLVRRPVFVYRWTHYFGGKTIAQVEAVAQEKDIYVRHFRNGEWVAVKNEHDCCTGAGYIANIFYGSDGRILVNLDHNYCFIGALEESLDDIEASDLKEFYSNLHITMEQGSGSSP